ncbi:fatty acyl-CoA reductase 1-like [Tribolium madens]|uniref:fatty acyl-CoA reductase 1-like n=1 Tax=Tribolium madens TaxID=41895 RepID=UPI001CF73711|nr:fatty acyl-CoA reductase 1-like [Tribolium madens]XP_044260932.1 fatty acyl-CoA reductase 1-like [Tribolium madens]
MSNKSAVAEFYKNRHILITGATGFMGKVLIEKLLRSCPKLSTIYLLVRPKKGKKPNERLEDIVNCPVFDKLRDQPDGETLLNKIYCIAGDITQPNLNLSNDDEKTLKDNVELVFHMAANVRFDQPLKSAVLLNTGGTKNLLDLACAFKQLKIFIHVSTSYCHCNEVKLEEKLYKAPHDPRKILDLVTWMDDETLKTLTPKLLKKSPNTYAYTKCLTEQLVSEYASKLPLVITRPSIVTAAWREPIPGWVDNLNGPTGLLVGAGKGVIRSMHCDPSLEANMVPVDSAINSLLLIGWKEGTDPSRDLKVYHVTSNNDNVISWGEALDVGRKHFYDNPFSVCLWYPGGSIKSNYWYHAIAVFFLHIIPAYLVDFLMVLTGNKPFLVRTQKRIQNGLEVLQYYTTRPWYFYNENLDKIWRELSNIDKEIFFTDRLKIDYNQYILNYVLGARKYCVHEEPETIPYARKVLKRLFYLDLTKNIILGLVFFWIFSYYVSGFITKLDNRTIFNNNTILG